jgi:hypothetical protein
MITIDTIDERLSQSMLPVTMIDHRAVRSSGLGDLWRRLWTAQNEATFMDEPANSSGSMSGAKNLGRSQLNRTRCAELSAWFVCLVSNIR